MNKHLYVDSTRLALVKQLLQQTDAMKRLGLTPEMYVAYKLGYSLGSAERDIQQVRETS